jgi:hypothetical protein
MWMLKDFANLPLISADDHGHSLHINSFCDDSLETLFQFLVETVEVFSGNRANIDW